MGPIKRLALARGGRSLDRFVRVRRRSPQLCVLRSEPNQRASIPSPRGTWDERHYCLLCQITSQARADEYSIQLESPDFVSSGVSQSGRIRPNRLFTADSAIVVYRAGHVREQKLREVLIELPRF